MMDHIVYAVPRLTQAVAWFAGLTGVQPARGGSHHIDIDGSVAAAKAQGYDPGQPTSMSRRTDAGDVLQWRLTPPQIELNDGLVPFLIDWGSTSHPTSRGLPQTRLTSWGAIHPTPEILQRSLAALGCQLHIAVGDQPAMTAVIEGHRGLVTLR